MNHAPVAVRSGTFQHRGFELAYEIYGDAGIPCLLVHGLLLDSLLNRDLAQRFVGEGYQVVLLDLLGHGRSDKPTDPREHRVDFYAEQVLACLDHLKIEKALVGGISLGAITALQFAAIAPGRLHGLFLEMPVMEWSATFAAALFTPMLTVVDYGKFLFRPFARVMRKLPRPRIGWLASAMNTASQEPEVITAVLHGILVGPVVPPARARREMDVPTLIIGHARDKLHELRDAEALVREMPQARLVKSRSIIELRLNPDRLWPEIQEFLRELRDSVASQAPRKAAG
jgi:pimeloyl-ACP methyl ester carboxylesterase